MRIDVLEEANPLGGRRGHCGPAGAHDRADRRPAWVPLTLLVRDDGNRVRGGIRGQIALCWLQVDQIWVDVTLRGKGYGSRLLGLAEDAARKHGAIGAQLTTSTFQAVGFYQKLGYAELGRLKDRPPGHDRIWMAKRWS